MLTHEEEEFETVLTPLGGSGTASLTSKCRCEWLIALATCRRSATARRARSVSQDLLLRTRPPATLASWHIQPTIKDRADAWKTPEPNASSQTGIGSRGFAGAQAGDLCTVRSGRGAFGPEGSPGHLRAIGNALICCADGYERIKHDQPDLATADQIKEVVYRQYDAELRDQWRRAK